MRHIHPNDLLTRFASPLHALVGALFVMAASVAVWPQGNPTPCANFERDTPVALPANVEVLGIADLNDDGDPDLYARESAQAREATIWYGTTGFQFRRAASVRLPVISEGGPSEFFVADFNGDGKTDLVVNQTLYRNDGNEQFSLLFTFSDIPLLSGDFNRDGKTDVLASTLLWLNMGNGQFTTIPLPTSIRNANKPAAADFNRDGWLDLATLENGQSSRIAVVYFGNGRGEFSLSQSFNKSFLPSRVVAGDFNHDNYADVAIVSAHALGGVQLHLNDGRGRIGEGSNGYGFGLGGELNDTSNVQLHDFNRDGMRDLLVTHFYWGFFSIFLADSNGVINPARLRRFSLIEKSNFGSNVMRVADFNQDGLPDVLYNAAIQPTLCTAAPRTGLTAANAASYETATLATNNSIVTLFGTGLSDRTVSAGTIPLPTTLGNVRVTVGEFFGSEREVQLIFVSPTQINFLLPKQWNVPNSNELYEDFYAIKVINKASGEVVMGNYQAREEAFGLFTANANGQGVAAAQTVRAVNGQAVYEPVAVFNAALNRFEPVPVDLTRANALVLYGTGFGKFSRGGGHTFLTATVGGQTAEVLYIGVQPSFAGLDQINIRLPNTLAGRGLVNLVISSYDSRLRSNTVQLAIK